MAGEGESAIGVLQRVVIITTITPAAGKLATASESEMCAAAPEQQEAEGARRVRVLLQGMEVEMHLQQAQTGHSQLPCTHVLGLHTSRLKRAVC